VVHKGVADDRTFARYLTDLAAEMAYQQAVLSRVQAQATRFGDTAALYHSLGGGWWHRTGTLAESRE
jgi:outer membrane protein TolC